MINFPKENSFTKSTLLPLIKKKQSYLMIIDNYLMFYLVGRPCSGSIEVSLSIEDTWRTGVAKDMNFICMKF